MDGDVAFREHRHARYAVGLEMMQVYVQQCRARCFDTTSQCRFNVIDIVEPLRAVQISSRFAVAAPTVTAKSFEFRCARL